MAGDRELPVRGRGGRLAVGALVLDHRDEEVGFKARDAELAGGGEQGAALGLAEHRAFEPSRDVGGEGFAGTIMPAGMGHRGRREPRGSAAGPNGRATPLLLNHSLRRACGVVSLRKLAQFLVQALGLLAMAAAETPGRAAIGGGAVGEGGGADAVGEHNGSVARGRRGAGAVRPPATARVPAGARLVVTLPVFLLRSLGEMPYHRPATAVRAVVSLPVDRP